jgi:DNA-binding IclR family transcriptional regulator
MPAHATALGKAILAYLPDDARDDLLAGELPKLTARTLPRRALLDALESVRANNFARERDEAVIGEASVAAPIFDHAGHAVGAIGVVGDTDRLMPRGPAKGITAAVADAARGVSRELGARRWPVAG